MLRRRFGGGDCGVRGGDSGKVTRGGRGNNCGLRAHDWRIVPLLPLEAASNTGTLFGADGLSGQRGIDRVSQASSIHQDLAAWTAVIELAVIDQPAAAVVNEELGSGDSMEGSCHLL